MSISDILLFFWQDFLHTNEKLLQVVTTIDRSRPFATYNIYLLYGIYGVITYGILTLNAILLANHASSRLAMYTVLVLNVPMVMTAILLPSGSVNFFLAVQSFTYLMNLQGRALRNLQKHQSTTRSASTQIQQTQKQETWWDIYTSAIYFGVPSRVEIVVKKRFPSLSIIYHGLYIMIVSDFTNYLIYEYVPFVISPANQSYAKAILGTVWMLFALEFAYWNLNMGFNMFGMPLSPKLLHKNPLLSTNVTRFWGVNWNPIIGKLLQDSFYLPFVRMNVPKWICALLCFLGSGLFHAVPYFISRLNLHRAGTILLFFFIQAVGIIIESAMDPIMRLPKPTLTESSSSSSLSEGDKTDKTDKKEKKEKKEKKGNNEKHKKRSNAKEEKKSDDKLPVKQPVVDSKKDNEVIANEYAKVVAESNRFFRIEIGFMYFMMTVMNAIYEVGWEPKNLAAIIILGTWSLSEIMTKHVKAAKNIAHKRNQPNSFWSILIRLIIGWAWTIMFIMINLELFIPPMIEVLGQFYDKACVIGPIYRTILYAWK